MANSSGRPPSVLAPLDGADPLTTVAEELGLFAAVTARPAVARKMPISSAACSSKSPESGVGLK
jgi:hypothetical protein